MCIPPRRCSRGTRPDRTASGRHRDLHRARAATIPQRIGRMMAAVRACTIVGGRVPTLGTMAVNRSRKAKAARKRKRRMERVEHDLSDEQWTALKEAWGGCAYC